VEPSITFAGGTVVAGVVGAGVAVEFVAVGVVDEDAQPPPTRTSDIRPAARGMERRIV